MIGHNRQMRFLPRHDVDEPSFKRLKGYFHHGIANKIRRNIKAENLATRSVPDSWADIARENERKKRIAKIRESYERTEIEIKERKGNDGTTSND